METVLGSLVTHPALSDTVKDKNGKKRKTALDATKVSANGGWQAKIESLDELLTDVSGKLGITIDYSEHKKHDSEESDEDDEGDVTTSMVELDNGQQRYIGKSSGLPLTHTTEHATQLLLLGKEASPTAKDNVHVQVSKAPVSTHTIAQLNVPSWAYELPPANVATHFISLYFERIYPFHPIPHRALFMDRLQKPMNNPFLILLNAIYALACKFSHDEAIRDLYGEKRSAGRIFYDRAKAILNECFDESSHTTVEALIIMSQFQHGSGENMSSWLLSGMAIRMAQDLGLHRDMSKSKDFNGAENEARKRVWWACFFNDTMSSAVMGRPLSIDEKESDTQLLDESEICMVVHGVSVPVYFNAILRLFQIFRKILRAVYGLRANNLNKVQRPLDQSFMDPALSGLLDAWTLQLHEQLRTKVEDLNMESTSDPCVPRLFLHLWHGCIRILLHRPQVQSNDMASRLYNDDWRNCIEAASYVARSAFQLHQHKCFPRYGMAGIVYCIFQACVVHINVLTMQNGSVTAESRRAAMYDMQRCMAALRGLEATWTTAFRARFIMDDLLKRHSITLPSLSTEHVRQRSQSVSHESVVVDTRQRSKTLHYPQNLTQTPVYQMGLFSNNLMVSSPQSTTDNTFWGWNVPLSLDFDEWETYFMNVLMDNPK